MKTKSMKIITAEPLRGMVPDKVIKRPEGAAYLYNLNSETMYRRALILLSLYNATVITAAGTWRQSNDN